MSISGTLVVTGAPPSVAASRSMAQPPSLWVGRGKERGSTVGGRGMAAAVVECSSRPNKKATSHHMKTRPKKTQPWDMRRKGPTVYPPLPALPPDWTLASSQQPTPEQKPQEAAATAAAPPAL